MKKKKFNNFSDFILNSQYTMPVLLTISLWAGFVFSIGFLFLAITWKNTLLTIIALVFTVGTAHTIYKFYFKLGGMKVMATMNAGETVYGKKIKVK